MRYWLDAEFIEFPSTIDLISIGIVSEDEREFYAESSEVDWSRADEWIRQNVKPHLLGIGVPRTSIRDGILGFVGSDSEPEFWGYYADYDWVAFCWLFGRMIDLPKGWPKFCRDIKQRADDLGNPKLPQQTGTKHHALPDANWNRQAWLFLEQFSKGGVMSNHPNPCLACEALGAPTEGMTGLCKSCVGNFCFGHLGVHEGNCRGPFYKGDEPMLDLSEVRSKETILATIRRS
jgi:hypothetical protein